MTASDLSLRPLLQRHPDARRASAPLLHPILMPYLALMFGSGIAALAGIYNALMLRRGGLALRTLLLAVGGWIAFIATIVIARQSGLENMRVALILGRVVHFAFGGLLYAVQRPHFRGNEFLGGSTVPILPSYLVALLISMRLPDRVTLLLLGVPNVG